MSGICLLWFWNGHLVLGCRSIPWHVRVFHRTPLTTSEAVTIGTTLLLAVVAFIAPYVVWRLQRRHLAPRLRVSYDHSEPMARLSSRSVGGRPTGTRVFDFHFLVRNLGRTPARNVVAEIVEFWYDHDGLLVRLKEFLPVYLRYHQTEYVDIHPQRPYYWNIGSIPSREIQRGWDRRTLDDAPGKAGRGLRFALDLLNAPHNQTNVLLTGTYGIMVVLYSENAKPEVIRLRIEWSGRWRASATAMSKEIVITQVDSFG